MATKSQDLATNIFGLVASWSLTEMIILSPGRERPLLTGKHRQCCAEQFHHGICRWWKNLRNLWPLHCPQDLWMGRGEQRTLVHWFHSMYLTTEVVLEVRPWILHCCFHCFLHRSWQKPWHRNYLGFPEVVNRLELQFLHPHCKVILALAVFGGPASFARFLQL